MISYQRRSVRLCEAKHALDDFSLVLLFFFLGEVQLHQAPFARCIHKKGSEDRSSVPDGCQTFDRISDNLT